MWILLAVWALMMFGCAFFLIIRLARYDMVKKELERPLIIQSALPVASYRNPPPQRQQVESRASQNSFSTGDTVRGSITLAE